MARGTYTVRFTNTAITVANADADYFALTPGAVIPITLIGLFIGNNNIEGDANEDFVEWGVVAMTGVTFTAGTGGTAPTPAPTNFPGEDAAEFTARVMDTAIATTSGTTTHGPIDTFNVRAGLRIWFPPEARTTIYPGTGNNLIVRQYSTLDATTNFSGVAYVKEGAA